MSGFSRTRHPPSRLVKIGVKPGWRAFGAASASQLGRLLTSKKSLKSNEVVSFSATHAAEKLVIPINDR